MRNQYVMVVDFNGLQVQLPTDDKNTDTVFVKKEKDKYTITDKLEEEKPVKARPVSRVKKQKKVTEVELADDVTTDNTEKSE